MIPNIGEGKRHRKIVLQRFLQHLKQQFFLWKKVVAELVSNVDSCHSLLTQCVMFQKIVFPVIVAKSRPVFL